MAHDDSQEPEREPNGFQQTFLSAAGGSPGGVASPSSASIVTTEHSAPRLSPAGVGSAAAGTSTSDFGAPYIAFSPILQNSPLDLLTLSQQAICISSVDEMVQCTCTLYGTVAHSSRRQ